MQRPIVHRSRVHTLVADFCMVQNRVVDGTRVQVQVALVVNRTTESLLPWEKISWVVVFSVVWAAAGRASNTPVQ